MNKFISTLSVLAVFSTPTFAAQFTFSGAAHCAEDVQKHATAAKTLIQSQGALAALEIMATENVGAVEEGYFYYDPTFERTNRYFNCSIPLTENMGDIELGVYGIVNGLNNAFGGCSVARMRKVSDGGIDKWFRFDSGDGFDWISLQDSSIQGDQFVNYKTQISNNYEADSTLELKCRTTWEEGSVALGQITLTY